MLSENAIRSLVNLTRYLEANKFHLVIDGDTHPSDLANLPEAISKRLASTPNYYQGRPISEVQLLDSMEAAGVDMSLIWQNPAAFQYTNDLSENFDKLLRANMDIARFAAQHPGKFIPAGWTDPKALGVAGAIRLTEICVGELGFPIVKMNPAQNRFPIDSPQVFEVLHRITALGATPAFHFGGDSDDTPASGLERILTTFADHKIIGVHMGGGGSHYVHGDQTYLDARELGLRHENLFYILSAKRDCHIESDLVLYTRHRKPFSENIACGSDAPYGLQSWNFGAYAALFDNLRRGKYINAEAAPGEILFSEEVIQNYLGTNLANLVIESCIRVLIKNNSTILL